jgi:hypothetical protein
VTNQIKATGERVPTSDFLGVGPLLSEFDKSMDQL